VILLVVIVVWGIAKGGNSLNLAGGGGPTGNAFDRLAANGTPARGIMLRVAATGRMQGTVARRFQVRACTIDVEIAGKPPYTVQASPLIPLNLVRDVLPGATLELRVDPNDPSNIAIVGPGAGFSPMALLAQVSTPTGN
jgi:hypothetical protein